MLEQVEMSVDVVMDGDVGGVVGVQVEDGGDGLEQAGQLAADGAMEGLDEW